MTKLLHHYLRDAAERGPEATAVIDGATRLSYADLDARADSIGAHLVGLGIVAGDRVGIYADKSHAAVAAIYGVLKSGAAYVILDVTAPEARLARIAADAGLAAVLCDRHKIDVVQTWAPVAMAMDAPEFGSRVLPPPDGRQADNDLAYIFFTSGSTGTPKGVAIEHRQASAFVRWAGEHFAVVPGDRIASHAPLHFDLSVFDLFAAARAGAAVVLVPPVISMFPARLADFISEFGITIWYSVPAVLARLGTSETVKPESLSSLRRVLFAGEVFPPGKLAAIMRKVPGAGFANLYGPTETNVCTFHEVSQIPAANAGPIPIGRAIAGTRAWAVGESGVAVQGEGVGELYVSGPTVMRGYWNAPEATAGKIVRFGDVLACRTGDVVRAHGDGTFTFLGRRDGQLKKNGYRIEAGEVEAAILSRLPVTECAVGTVKVDDDHTALVAYVVGTADVADRDVLAACHELLPRYMVPDLVRRVAVLPRTSTGKLDRMALARGGQAVSAA